MTHSPKQTVPEILNAAADLLEKPGAWTQGTFARSEDGQRVDMWSQEAKCFCVGAAIQRIEGRHRYGAWNRFDGLTRQRGFRHMAEWNDDPKRTQAEVVATLRQAAERAARPTQEGA